MRVFLKSHFRSFYFLNATQFFGALNDNFFKFLIVFFLINLKGNAFASGILAKAGAVFVIPFLVFSSASGVLADRISKRNILVIMKIAEIIIMSFGVLAIYLKTEFGVFFLLFLMATQSTIFGPSKYGIIPEIVGVKKLSKANSLLSSFTFLAIIFGTFLASFLTDITNKSFVLVSLTCVIIAIAGFFSSIHIEKTLPKNSTKKINPLFFYEIYKSLVLSSKRRHLLPSIFGSAFFLFLGGYIQLNVIPFAIQSLKLSEVGGGYLFASTAIGIAIGSITAGKLSKDNVHLGLSCIAGFFVSIFSLLLFVFSHFLYLTIIILTLLGIAGGIFIVPYDSFIQLKSPKNRRGQFIAASNFLSFCGVLIAAFFLYLVNDVLGFKASTGFAFMSIITFIFTLVNTGRLADTFFPYFAKKILSKFYYIKISQLPEESCLLMLKKKSTLHILLLFAILPNLKIITSGKTFKNFPFLNCLFSNIFMMSPKNCRDEKIIVKANSIKDKNDYVCLSMDNTDFDEKYLKGSNFSKFCYLDVKTEKIEKKILLIKYKKKQITFSTEFVSVQNA